MKSIFSVYFRIVLVFGILLILNFIYRYLFYYLNLNIYSDVDFSQFLDLSIGGLQFDTSSLLYLNVFFILLWTIPVAFKYNKLYSKIVFWVFIIPNSIGFLANIVDIVYFPFVGRRLTIDVFSEFQNDNQITKIIFSTLFTYWYLLVLWVFTILILLLVYNKLFSDFSEKLYRTVKYRKFRFYFLSSLLFLLTIYFTVFGIRGSFIYNTRPIAISNAGKYTSKPNQINIVINSPFSILRTLKKPGLRLVNYMPEEKIIDYIQIQKNIYKDSLSVGEGKNVIIFIMESMASNYSAFYNQVNTPKKFKGFTPYLDSIYSNSYTFTYSFANGRKSIDAMPSILSSIPKVKVPFSLSKYAANNITGLGYYLKKLNYNSYFYHGAPNGSMAFNSLSKLFGYENYIGMDEYPNKEDFDDNWGIYDDKFLNFMGKDISKNAKQPFLVTVFTLSSHHPFVLPPGYEDKYDKGWLENHQVIQYGDESVSNFMKKYKNEEWFKNSIFIFTADHVSVNDYPEYNNSVGNYRVPVAIYSPENILKKNGIINDTINAQQIDILPTILHLVGYEGKYSSFGQDLLVAKSEDHFIYSNFDNIYQIIYKNFVYLFDIELGKGLGLYDFKKDILMKNNLMEDSYHKEILDKMDIQIKAFIQKYHEVMIKNTFI